jgi:hypothetical protein
MLGMHNRNIHALCHYAQRIPTVMITVAYKPIIALHMLARHDYSIHYVNHTYGGFYAIEQRCS